MGDMHESAVLLFRACDCTELTCSRVRKKCRGPPRGAIVGVKSSVDSWRFAMESCTCLHCSVVDEAVWLYNASDAPQASLNLYESPQSEHNSNTTIEETHM